jgi:sigma-B regulation protein RsbU (phosphoserine phosphatase)
VLLDLNLPDSSGIETFHKLSSQSNGTPIIVLSGVEDGETAVEAVGAGADDYVQKNHYDAHTLARSVRFAIERSTRLKTERELISVRSELSVAQNIQDSLYPKKAPNVDGYDIAAGVRSAGIGCGDYFDFVTLSDGRLIIVVGDVAGHGMGPAIVMAETRACLRTLVDLNVDPKVMMPSMNRLIFASSSAGMFVTLMMVVFDPAKDTFEYFNAGHPGWVLRSHGAERLITHQIPLGMLQDVDHAASHCLKLNSNDILIIPTDGIPETQCGADIFGSERTIQSVNENRNRPASEIVDALFADATNFAAGEKQADDMTLVIVKSL